MLGLKRNTVVKFAVVLCAALQVLLLTPHHHHDGAAEMCINPLHCIGGPDHSDACHHDCGGHDAESDNCSFTEVDIVVASSEHEHSAGCFCMPFVAEISSPTEMLSALTEVVESDLAPIHPGDIPDPRIVYIIAATPPRAPSFTV